VRVFAAALAAGLALATPVAAHDPALEVRFSPGYAWASLPGGPPATEGRVRVVPQPNHGRAALTVNQFEAYQLAYRRHLARLSLRMPIREAQAHARHAAWHEVVAANRTLPVRELDLVPLEARALPLTLSTD
jgi:hypothetical protein